MKPKRYKILSAGIKWMVVVALGYFIVLLTYHICQGPDRCLDLGDGYAICHFPGRLYYWPPEYHYSMLGLLEQDAIGLLTTDEWIIGKTENYWFAVDKKNRRIYYPLDSEEEVKKAKEYLPVVEEKIRHTYCPLDSEEEVKKIAGLDFSPSDMMTEFPRLSFWWPSHEYKFKTASIFGFTGIVGVGYVIIVFSFVMMRRAQKRRRKLRNGTNIA